MTFTLRGVEVHIGFGFAFLLCVLLTCLNNRILLYAVWFSLLHECGHLLCDAAFGEKPARISFGIFGMSIVRRDDTHLSFRQEICSALAGPAVNLAAAVCFACAYGVQKKEWQLLCFAVNGWIFLFQAMPVFSLDGGRAFDAALHRRTDDMKRIRRTELLVSFLCLCVVMGLGFWVLLYSRYNFTLLLLAVYLLILLFLKC